MNVISTSYTLNTKWLEHLSSDFGTKLENDKLLPVPEYIGNGFFYYVEVMPGFFILLINIAQTSNFKIDRHPSEDEVFIFHYDLSDEIILFKAKEKLNKIGYKVNLGFTLIDGNIPNYIEPTINSNVFALRFVISKSFLHSYTGDKFISKKNKHICFHNHIDSKSILHIKTLKEKIIFDDSFELYLKGVGIEVFAIFVKRYSGNKSDSYRFLQIEVDEIAKTKDYLLNSLHNS